MRQLVLMMFIILAGGCVSNQQACEQEFTDSENVKLCKMLKDQADRAAWHRMMGGGGAAGGAAGGGAHAGEIGHGAGGCVPNHSTGGCL